MQASDAITGLKGVGPGVAAKLEKLGLRTMGDLLFHCPLRYEDRTHLIPVQALRAGMHALVLVRIEQAELHRGRRRSLVVSATDGGGRLWLRFFHFSQSQVQQFKPGLWVQVFAEVRPGRYGLEMVHPEYRIVAERSQGERVAARLTPVYPATSGITQQRLRQWVETALCFLDQPDFLPELLPEEIREDRGMPALAAALRLIHAPPPDAQLSTLAAGTHPAIRRLAFEELLAQQLGLRARRQRIRKHRAPALAGTGQQLKQFYRGLGFEFTAAQKRVLAEILADMSLQSPMLRLVQGDVGSGKTVVAAAAAVTAAEASWQSAFMAPTELLAEQHYRNMQTWLSPINIPVWLLTGRLPKKERSQVLADLAGGAPGVVVGTHALFQDEVAMPQLGLVIVDEQHRFGVHQRMALRNKGAQRNRYPHQLIMTATPIPRTLAMSAYADLDTSVIDELPPGRQPISTIAISEKRRAQVVQRVAEACAKGRQAYWVCTLIDESEVLQCRAAEATAEELATTLPDLRIGLAHGRMTGTAKEKAMLAFKQGEMDLLVATTVIEVGVDVPNASLMVIENAERLGLAQLHQLRGRVGRGSEQSHCVLMYQPPLGETARKRIAVLRASNDGFVIAREDLKLRGPGEVLGTRQTGSIEFKIADLMRDADMASAAQAAADRMLAAHPQAAQALMQRWLGRESAYASV